MRLSVAARYFDDLVCADAFNSSATFSAQLVPYTEGLRDAATADRRILAFDPRITLPARKVLLIGGEYWVAGNVQNDYYRGGVFRVKCVLHKAQGAVKLCTPVQLLSTGGVDTYGGRLWLKDTKETTSTSAVEALHNFYLPASEGVQAGDVITIAGVHCQVRDVYLSAAGFLTAECFEMPAGALTTGTYKTRAYTPATDTLALSAGAVINVLRLRFTDDFVYPNEAATKFVDGDIRALITQAAVATPKANDVLVLADATWEVIAAQSERNCWNLHLRHAAAR